MSRKKFRQRRRRKLMSVYLLLLFLFAKHLMRRWKHRKEPKFRLCYVPNWLKKKFGNTHNFFFLCSVYFRVEGTYTWGHEMWLTRAENVEEVGGSRFLRMSLMNSAKRCWTLKTPWQIAAETNKKIITRVLSYFPVPLIRHDAELFKYLWEATQKLCEADQTCGQVKIFS